MVEINKSLWVIEWYFSSDFDKQSIFLRDTFELTARVEAFIDRRRLAASSSTSKAAGSQQRQPSQMNLYISISTVQV